MKISLHMIVRDEEEVLARCLDAIEGLYDELVIVDTGSLDKTKEIAAKYGARIYDMEWVDNFGKARQYALDQCTGDIVGYCDADMVFDGDVKETRKYLIEQFTNGIDMVSAPYVWGSYNPGEPPSLVYNLPWFFRREKFQWVGAVHEFLRAMEPEVKKCSTDLFGYGHRRGANGEGYKDRNLRILRKVVQEDATPRDWFYYGSECTYHALWQEAIVALQRYVNISTFPAEHARALYEIAHAYFVLGDNQNAQEWAFRAISKDPRYSEPYNLLGAINVQNQQWHLALGWYLHASNLPVPDTQWFDYLPPRTYVPLEWSAICYWKLGDKDKACACHEKALAYDPKNTWLVSNDEWFKKGKST